MFRVERRAVKSQVRPGMEHCPGTDVVLRDSNLPRIHAGRPQLDHLRMTDAASVLGLVPRLDVPFAKAVSMDWYLRNACDTAP